jgi:hypothetical protein
MDFHIWAAALLKDKENRRHLIIWDCDKHGLKESWVPEHAKELRRKDVAEHNQKELLKQVQPKYMWLYLGSRYKAQDLCHRFSWEQLERCVAVGDKVVVEPEEG